MNDVMIDLETMSTAPDAAIVAIGAVKMDLQAGTLGDTFYRTVDLQSAIDTGGRVDGSTIMWWLAQEEKAKAALAVAPIHINGVLQKLAAFLGDDSVVWGNGAAFDNVILTTAYKRCVGKRPWSYKNDMCYRTVRATFPGIKAEENPKGAAHIAVNDAIYQANHLIKIYKEGRLS